MTSLSSQNPGQFAESPRPLAVHGTVPLAPRLEPWMQELIADPHVVRSLIEEHGSPVNVLDPRPLARNAAELVAAGTALGVDTRVFFARKANKALAFVDAARAAGHCVDVASLNELRPSRPAWHRIPPYCRQRASANGWMSGAASTGLTPSRQSESMSISTGTPNPTAVSLSPRPLRSSRDCAQPVIPRASSTSAEAFP